MMPGNTACRRLVCLCAVFCLLFCGCGASSGDARSHAAIAAEASNVLIPEFSELAERLDNALPSDAESIQNDIRSASDAAGEYAAKAAACRCGDEKLENAVDLYLTRLQFAANGLLETAEEVFSGEDPLQSEFRLSVFQNRCSSEFLALADDISLYASLSNNGKKTFDFSDDIQSALPSFICETPEQISPALYEALDAVLLVYGVAPDNGATVRVDCEIPGLTKSYSEFYEISPRGSVLRILPERLDTCEAGETEILFSITDTSTGKLCASGSNSVTVDKPTGFALREDDYGRITSDALKLFLRPEDGFVRDLSKTAEDYETLLSGSAEVSLRARLTALQCAVSDTGIRLRKGAETFSPDALPDEILLPVEIRALGTCSLLDLALLEAGALCGEEIAFSLLLLDSGLFLAVPDSDGSVCLLDPSVLPVTTAEVDRVVRVVSAADYDVLQKTAFTVIEVN